MNREWTPTRFNTEQANPAVIAPAPDESLVRDARAGLTPAQMVESKLMSLLPLDRVVVVAEPLLGVDRDTQLQQQLLCVPVLVPLLDRASAALDALLRDLKSLGYEAHARSPCAEVRTAGQMVRYAQLRS